MYWVHWSSASLTSSHSWCHCHLAGWMGLDSPRWPFSHCSWVTSSVGSNASVFFYMDSPKGYFRFLNGRGSIPRQKATIYKCSLSLCLCHTCWCLIDESKSHGHARSMEGTTPGVGTNGGIHWRPLTNNLLKYCNIILLYQLQTGFTSFAFQMWKLRFRNT